MQRDSEIAGGSSSTPLHSSTTHLPTTIQPHRDGIPPNDGQNKIARRTHADAPSELTADCLQPCIQSDEHVDPAVAALWNIRHADTAPVFTLYHAPELYLAAPRRSVSSASGQAPASSPFPSVFSPPSTSEASPSTPASSTIASHQGIELYPPQLPAYQQPRVPPRSAPKQTHTGHAMSLPLYSNPHQASSRQPFPWLKGSMAADVHKIKRQLSTSQAQNEALVVANRQLLTQLQDAHKSISRSEKYVDWLNKEMQSMKIHISRTEVKVESAQKAAAKARDESRNAQEVAAEAQEKKLNDVVEIAALEVLKNQDYVEQIQRLTKMLEEVNQRLLRTEEEAGERKHIERQAAEEILQARCRTEEASDEAQEAEEYALTETKRADARSEEIFEQSQGVQTKLRQAHGVLNGAQNAVPVSEAMKETLLEKDEALSRT